MGFVKEFCQFFRSSIPVDEKRNKKVHALADKNKRTVLNLLHNVFLAILFSQHPTLDQILNFISRVSR